MTRIGFAYNQKPDPVDIAAATELPSVDEEPPSKGALATLAAPAPALVAATDDEYAEWDSAETIDAVAHALARHGQVIRLEATDNFPQRLREARPDNVFNIAESSAASGGTVTVSSGSLNTTINAPQQISIPMRNYEDCGGKPYPSYDTWDPQNSTGFGTYNLYTGTQLSVNTFYAQLEERTGLCKPFQLARSMGVDLTNPAHERVP